MKKVAVTAALLMSTTVMAECYVRMDAKLTREAVFGTATDVQQMVSRDSNGYRCVAQYRINLNGDWHTAEGVGHGVTETQACQQAIDLKNSALLAEVEPHRIKSKTEMVCSTFEPIQIRKVRVGERIRESEVDVHVVPAERRYFNYGGARCRMFVERDAKSGKVFTRQGVICQETQQPNSSWIVVDKY